MKPHKWAKEIKAWADGAEIEVYYESQQDWCPAPNNPTWNDEYEYRIKSQSTCEKCEKCGQKVTPSLKEPQYLYVWLEKDTDAVVFDYEPPGNVKEDEVHKYIGKIKLEEEI